jgi:hypothetical protein
MADLTEHTLVADPAVLQSWREGPVLHLVAAVLPPHSEVEQRRRRIADALGGLVDPGPPGQPHITVWVTGPEPTPVFGRRTVTVTVGGTATFASAAYLSVIGPALEECRQDLAARWPPEDRRVPYVHHVAIGTYLRRVPMAEARAALAPWNDLSRLHVRAELRTLVLDPRSGRLTAAD